MKAALGRGTAVFLLAVLAYAGMVSTILRYQSPAPHFVYLAQAFLDGKLGLTQPLPDLIDLDLIPYNGEWYVAQEPLPALLFLPVVKWRGVGISDIALTVGLGALSVALCDFTLGQVGLRSLRRSLLTLFYALGTPHGYMSALGTVWFSGQIAATLCLWLFALGLVRRRAWLAGVGLSLAALGRPSVVPGALILIALWWWNCAGGTLRERAERLLRPALAFSLPFMMSMAFIGWYNAARFGSPFDFGYEYIRDSPSIAERRTTYGLFNFAFLPDNVYTATLRPPLSDGTPDPWGMGLLLTSPLLVFSINRRQALLGIGALLMLLPSLLYHNSGSLQFGYRFILDALPILMLLLADRVRTVPVKWIAALTIWSVAVHLWGMAWIYERLIGQPWLRP